MGYKAITTNETKSIPDSSRNAIEDSRVYDHYDYAFDDFETYDQDDFESEEACCREVESEKSKTPRRSTKVLHNTGSKDGQFKLHPRWEKLKSQDTLSENSHNWFSQDSPFNLHADPNASCKLWKLIQTDPEAWSRSRATQTHQVAQVTVASMAPDDLATPTLVPTRPTKRLCNLPYSMFRSNTAQESQLKSFLTYAAYVLESLVARSTQQASIGLRLCDVVNEDHSSGGLIYGSMTLIDTLCDNFLDGRRVQFISFKESSSTTLLCCYGPGSSGSNHARKGCICIYDVLSKPSLQFTLLLQGVPTCASWSVYTQRNHWGIIVAGTQDGTLALWDLSSQPVGTLSPESPLYPTYSTCYRIEDNHTAAIQSVSLYSNSMSRAANASLGGGTSGNFLKLLSVDKLGFVHMWIVEEVQVNAARDDELGLHPDGRLCLVRTGTSRALPRSADALEIAMPETCRFAFIPGCVQEILVALTDGTLVKTSLVGSKPCAPRKYYRQALKGSKPKASPIVSLCFSPFVEECFLVAYADCTVAIFTADKPYPWGVWTLPWTDSDGHIISAQWSPLESTVLFVAVSSRRVYVFDLSLGLANPKFCEALQMDPSDEILCFEMSHREACGNRKPDEEYSFVTASVFGDVKVHLLRKNSDDYQTQSLRYVLLTPSDIIP